jgi:hypothetical protein
MHIMLLVLRNGLQTSCCVEWLRCSPHATDCAFRYIPHEHLQGYLYRMLQDACTRAGCKRSHTELLRCMRPRQLPDGKSHQGHACSGAGCWLRSTAQKHCPPSVTVQAVTARAARVVTYKTEASVRVSPQSVGMEHLDAAVSPISPQPAREHPRSHETISLRVLHSGHTP